MTVDRFQKISKASWLVAVAGLILLVGAAFGHALRVPFSHDEHQFVASGAMVAMGLLPYRDFPLHHLPYSAALYALTPLFTDRLLLAARLLSGLFGASTLILLFFSSWRIWKEKVGSWAPIAGLATALIVAASPLFSYTSGRAWNHDLSVFLVFTSLVLLLWRQGASGITIFGSGLALGFAVGTRMTAALVVVPMGLYLVWNRWSELLSLGSRFWKFISGLFIALIPIGLLLLLAPARFYYGNWVYHQLNTAYRRSLGHGEAMGLLGKGRYIYEQVILEPSHLVLLAGLVMAIAVALIHRRKSVGISSMTVMALTVSVFLLLGSILPTPAWLQYFYAPLPFAVLGLFLALAEVASHDTRPALLPASMMIAALAMAILRGGLIQDWAALATPAETTVGQAHRIAEAIDRELKDGRVITLAPIFALEAGASIEPSLTPGPFAYRVSPLLGADYRDRYGLISPDELVMAMRREPPEALLTGVESGNIGLASDPAGTVEEPLIAFAESEDYQPVMIPNELFNEPLVLWLKPK